MAEFQRKIELQSPDDLQYLISNVRRAANEKIDRDLPPIEGEDKMRERVETLVHDVRPIITPAYPSPSLENPYWQSNMHCSTSTPSSSPPPKT